MAIGARPCALGRRQRANERLHEGADDARRSHGRIEPWENAPHDALAQDALETMRELCTVVETDGLDFGIDWLGQSAHEPIGGLAEPGWRMSEWRLQAFHRRPVSVGDGPNDADLAC